MTAVKRLEMCALLKINICSSIHSQIVKPEVGRILDEHILYEIFILF